MLVVPTAGVHRPNKPARKQKDSCWNSGRCSGSCLSISGKETSGHDFALNRCLTRAFAHMELHNSPPERPKLHFSTKLKTPLTQLNFPCSYIFKTQTHFHLSFFLSTPLIAFCIGFPLMASPDLVPNSSSFYDNVPPSRLKRKRKRREAREIRRKVQKLRWVVAGGRALRREHLFAKTASYILYLRLKVCALETILKLQDGA